MHTYSDGINIMHHIFMTVNKLNSLKMKDTM